MQRNKKKFYRKKAFTLIEILISVTVVSLIGVTLYSVFANGINAWRRGNENGNYERNIRFTSEKIARELRNVFKFSEIAFEGTEDSVMFPALILSKPNYDEDNTKAHYEVGRIAYFYDKGKDVLYREEKVFPEVVNEEKIDEGKVLIQNLSKLEFNYCYLDNATGTYKWKNDWKKEEQDSIPQAVKMKLSFKKGVAKEDEFSRIIFIPIGEGEQKKELVSITTEK